MAKPVRADHPEVIKLEYNARFIRFRLIERTVYINVYDVKKLFRCSYIPYEELNVRCNSYVRIVFFKDGGTLQAIESFDLPTLCRLGNHGIISKENQKAIDWIVETCKKIQSNNMNHKNTTQVVATGTSELIHISNDNGQRAVNARKLHTFLGSKTRFNDWKKTVLRITNSLKVKTL